MHSVFHVPRSAFGRPLRDDWRADPDKGHESLRRKPMLCIPLGGGQMLTGTPAQLTRLAIYLQASTTTAPDPDRLVRLQLWDGEVAVARYGELAVLARALTARTAPPVRARYSAPPTIQGAAAPALPGAGGVAEPADPYSAFRVPPSTDLVTQTLNARGTTGGLRFPTAAEADPADPAAWPLSGSAQPYVAQVCTADPASSWGWTPGGPLYWTPAGHILVAAARIALAHHLLLTTDQLLAIRWVRSPSWDCYLPAVLLNAWHLTLAGALARAPSPADHPTARLSDLPS
jgi:hypothetical protein